MPSSKKNKRILVHTCCAACASHVFFELMKENFEIISYFYNPEVHGRAEYQRRLSDLNKVCQKLKVELIAPKYDIQEFFKPLLPLQDKNSIKYISDKDRYRRKRCQMCISLLLNNTADYTKKLKIKNFTTTLLCSPYKEHNEIWDKGSEVATKNKINFFYKDFRKGYWNGRNYARGHDIIVPRYCGCSESIEEGRLE